MNWRTFRLNEISEIFDGPHATPKTSGSGPIFLGISSLDRGRLDLSQSRYISEEDFHNWTRRILPVEDDFVFSYETRIGEAALIPRGLRCCLGRRMGLVRVDRNKVIPRFFLYKYLSPDFQKFLKSKTIYGSTVDRISIKDFPNFPIELPSLKEQEAIVNILEPIDDKIDLNRRTNETLEAMARALFKSWFVDFDPVHAKAAGKAPAHMDADTAALFPDAFGEDGLPVGWKLRKLGEFANNRKSIVNPSETNSRTPYIGLEHMPKGSISLENWQFSDKVSSSKFLFDRRDILFGKLRPYFKKVGVAPISGICSTDILVIKPNEDHLHSFVTLCVSSSEFLEHVDRSSTGTKMPRTSWKDMASFVCPFPQKEITVSYENLVMPLIEKIISNVLENQTLTNLRDLLLPKLMSGEIHLREAEELAAGAA